MEGKAGRLLPRCPIARGSSWVRQNGPSRVPAEVHPTAILASVRTSHGGKATMIRISRQMMSTSHWSSVHSSRATTSPAAWSACQSSGLGARQDVNRHWRSGQTGTTTEKNRDAQTRLPGDSRLHGARQSGKKSKERVTGRWRRPRAGLLAWTDHRDFGSGVHLKALSAG